MIYPEHLTYLTARGVSLEVIEKRCVFSVPTKSALQTLGFGRAVPAPALVIPLWDVTGECDGYQIRCDEPRVDQNGRKRKFEVPAKFKPRLDVHPFAQPKLADPTIRLWLTEGIPKGDALVSAGELAVALAGVWMWTGETLADFEYLQPKGRTILICFDSDVMLKKPVHDALGRLGALLTRRGAAVAYVYLPDGPEGRKLGVDDFLAAGGTIETLLATHTTTELRRPAWEEPTGEQPDTFDDVDEEDGDQLLDDVVGFVRRYVWFPNDALADAIALWIVHTYARFEFAPRLHVKSPAKRSGKSRLLEVLEVLAHRALLTANVSTAALFRSIEKTRPTLLIDEVDRLFGERLDQDRSDLVGLLNAGFRRGATVLRVVGQGADLDVKGFDVFAPVALAGIGSIPDTIADRSVVIRLERRPKGTRVQPFRERAVKGEAAELRRRIAAWVHRHPDLADAEPDPPKGINDRAADLWEPLFAIADTVSADWLARATTIAVDLSKIADDEDARDSETLRLLKDICETWSSEADRRSTKEIISTLNELEGAPWADLPGGKGITANWLARRLSQFGADSKQMRVDGENRKGYYRDALVPAWERYGVIEADPPEADESDPDDAWEDVS